MKKVTTLLLALLVLASAAAAQDTVKVLVWDNDAGEPPQNDPGCLIISGNATYFSWTDWRYQHAEIESQRFSGSFSPIDSNYLVNDNFADGKTQANTVIAGTDTGSYMVAWDEDSASGIQAVYARQFNHLCQSLWSLNYKVSKNQGSGYSYTAFNPAVAVDHTTGRAVIAWTQQTSAGSRIFARVWTGTAWLDTVRIDDASGLQGNPAVAIHDTFVVVTWIDNRRGGGDYDIYARLLNNSLVPLGTSFFVNNVSPDSLLNQLRPTVAMSDTTDPANCYYTIAWEDYHYGGNYVSDIRFKQYKAVGTPGNISSVNLTTNTPNRRPCVAMGPRSKMFITVWEDSTDDVGKYNIKIRMYDAVGFRGGIKMVNSDTAGNQTRPKIDYNGTYATVAWLDSSRAGGKGDIFTQWFRSVHYTPDYDTLVFSGSNAKVNTGDKLRANGRSVRYHFPNYDNTGTAGWNEDPRLASAPDSIDVTLDSAYVMALKSRNITPGQSFVKVTDTDTLLAFTGQKLNGAADYDLCVMDLGYPETGLSSGTIDAKQRDSLVSFSAGGGALLCAGNDFGEYYSATSLFNLFGAVYDGPGNAAVTGNINTMLGKGGKFTQGMTYNYPYQQAEDNSVDIIHAATGADTIFYTNAAKWIRSTGISYSDFYKGPKVAWHKNVYLPFAMGAISSDGQYPNTVTELTRRIMAFQGFNIEPAPVTTMSADTGSALPEGSIVLNWTAVGDQSTSDSCKKYLLKFRRYDPSRSDSGRFTSETAFTDSGEKYQQAWVPMNAGGAEAETLYGLPPCDTLIFAIKAGDTSYVTRWGALGNEPRVKVKGDTLTPHTIGIGYPCGAVRDFIKQERLGINYGDTLYFTWDKNYAYAGYSGCDWRTAGDLFIYIDTRSSFGADSTIPDWNGSTADTASLFDTKGDFKPDYCFIFDNTGASCKFKRWTGSAWADTFATYPDTLYSLDSLHNYSYTEVKLPFKWIGYGDTTQAFKFQVLAAGEASEHTFNAFPPANTIGKSKAPPARYPYYYQINGLTSGKKAGDTLAVTRPLAVELSEFTAAAGQGAVGLFWRTASETGNYTWLIDRSQQPDAGYVQVAEIPSAGSSSAGHSYSYSDVSITPGITYYYRLGARDIYGDIAWHGPLTAVLSGPVYDKLMLDPCLPNPASGMVTISYILPKSGAVSLNVYDICGRKIRTLENGAKQTGRYSVPWKGDDDQGRLLPSGIYFYQLNAEGMVLTQKVVLLR